jgi:POT family proton-dependent oligopeptide transporter
MAKDPTSEFASPSATAVLTGTPETSGPFPGDTSFFGHPRGLSTLFFTEFWERFSYYGMRGILILFMTAAVAQGGLGMDAARAGAIYGLYTAFVYLTALPGGWLADRVFGQRRAVLIGGIIIAMGHFTMAIPAVTLALGELPPFYAGLVLIVLGTGLLKPNISTMVGSLYPEGGARRDAGFSIFYMGINMGAFLAPLVVGYLGEKVNWHVGFAVAGVGMVLGLIQYVVGGRHLQNVGRYAHIEGDDGGPQRRLFMAAGVAIGLIAVIALLTTTGMLSVQGLAAAGTYIIVLLSLGYFGYMFLAGGLDETERKRIAVIAILFIFSAIFWSGFEQAGSSLNLVAERLTDRNILGWEMPASWLQSVNPLFIIALAPVFAGIWISLARRNQEPSSPAKFSFGLVFLGLGFLVLVVATGLSGAGAQISPMWLVLTYLLHTIGELALSPVGLSTVTKLAPQRVVGQMMGVWFMSVSLGNLIAGQVAGFIETLPLPQLFGTVAAITIGAGLLLFLFVKPTRKLMGGVL